MAEKYKKYLEDFFSPLQEQLNEGYFKHDLNLKISYQQYLDFFKQYKKIVSKV
jgi:hypothetical protein